LAAAWLDQPRTSKLPAGGSMSPKPAPGVPPLLLSLMLRLLRVESLHAQLAVNEGWSSSTHKQTGQACAASSSGGAGTAAIARTCQLLVQGPVFL
jgi:hypothetical protein